MENINEENNNDHSTDDDTVSDAPLADYTAFDEPAFDEVTSEEPAFAEPTFAPPAPPTAPSQVEDRLVRDPHATFAGVLSGFAHRYGFDVALTRLAYIVLTFLLGGITIPVYLLAWIIIPRARYWPPVQRARTRTLSGRDIGFGLIGLATLVAIGIGAGEAAAVIVPLGLIVGGVWMLVQSPRNEVALAGAGAGPAMATERSSFSDSAGTSASGQGGWTTPQMPAFSPEPVQPRSRKRRFVTFGLLGAILLVPFLIIGGIIAAIAAGGNWDINFDEVTTITPVGVDDVPSLVEQEAGEIVLDLRNTDLSPLDESGAEPLEIAIDMDAGRIEVLLPADLDVQVAAEVDFAGDVTVFDRNDDGFGPTVTVANDDPQLILDVDLDVGEIDIVRSN